MKGMIENINFEEKLDKVNDTLRKIVGALNSGSGSVDIAPVMIKLATLETDVNYLKAGMKEIKTALWGLAASVLGLVAKMVIEGALR